MLLSMNCWCSSIGFGVRRRDEVLEAEAAGNSKRPLLSQCTLSTFDLREAGQLRSEANYNKSAGSERDTPVKLLSHSSLFLKKGCEMRRYVNQIPDVAKLRAQRETRQLLCCAFYLAVLLMIWRKTSCSTMALSV